MSVLKANYSLVPEHLLNIVSDYCKRTGIKKQKVNEEAIKLWIKYNIGE